MIFLLAASFVVSVLAGLIAAMGVAVWAGRTRSLLAESAAITLGFLSLGAVCYWLTWMLNPDPSVPGAPPSNATVLPIVGLELMLGIPLYAWLVSKLEKALGLAREAQA